MNREDTEKKIKQVAIDLLLKEGNFGVSLNEIAKQLSLSRTIVHYYFRSKQNLMIAVTNDILENVVKPKNKVLFEDGSLYSKCEKYLAVSEQISKSYPYLDAYITSQHSTNMIIMNYMESIQDKIDLLIDDIQKSIDEGKLIYSNPIYFLSDLLSLSTQSYMYLHFFSVSKSYQKKDFSISAFKNRKKRLLDILFSI